jgi:hypothetical protein
VLCLPDDAPELDDDAEMVSQVRKFIQDCSGQQAAERLPRVLMDPVDRWLEDLLNLNITNGAHDASPLSRGKSVTSLLAGLDSFNASSFMPPLLDWQIEAVDLNAALSAAIKDMGSQLLLLRPAVFKNPFENSQMSISVKASNARHDDATCKDADSETASEDFWQPYNPWSSSKPREQHRNLSPSLKLGHTGAAADVLPQAPLRSACECDPKADAKAANDKVFASVKKRVVIATRELIADKMRRMLPPQWLHPCILITGFVFKMCELERQERLRKEFLQSDIRLLLYTIYTRS